MEIESELEITQILYKEERNHAISLRNEAEEATKTIQELTEKLETQKRDAEKRRQLLSLLGPNSKENQEKVIFLTSLLHINLPNFYTYIICHCRNSINYCKISHIILLEIVRGYSIQKSKQNYSPTRKMDGEGKGIGE